MISIPNFTGTAADNFVEVVARTITLRVGTNRRAVHKITRLRVCLIIDVTTRSFVCYKTTIKNQYIIYDVHIVGHNLTTTVNVIKGFYNLWLEVKMKTAHYIWSFCHCHPYFMVYYIVHCSSVNTPINDWDIHLACVCVYLLAYPWWYNLWHDKTAYDLVEKWVSYHDKWYQTPNIISCWFRFTFWFSWFRDHMMLNTGTSHSNFHSYSLKQFIN